MMQVVGLAVAAVVGWSVGIGFNYLAAWLPRRYDDLPCSPAERQSKHPSPSCQRWRAVALRGATALVVAALWWRYGLSWALLPASLMALFLLLVAAIDIDRRLVLNEMLAVGAVLALLNAAMHGWTGLGSALLGGLLALGLFLLLALFQRGALGAGDVKLAGLLGLAFGYPLALRVLLLGVIVGGVVAAVLLLTRQVSRRTMIPYAPFLAAGGILVLLV
jgi:Flp pilus assembly protein protease CpaA